MKNVFKYFDLNKNILYKTASYIYIYMYRSERNVFGMKVRENKNISYTLNERNTRSVRVPYMFVFEFND